MTVEHVYGDTWTTDESGHWHACTSCGDRTDEAEHTFVWVVTKEAGVGVAGEKHEECQICGYEKASVKIPAMADSDSGSPETGDSSQSDAVDCAVVRVRRGAGNAVHKSDAEEAEIAFGSTHIKRFV